MWFKGILLLAFALQLSSGYCQWVKTNGPEGGLIRDIGVNGSTVFAATEHGVFRLGDSETVWESSSSGLVPQSTVYSLLNKGGNLFAGTENGVYRSIDNGITWSSVGSGLTGSIVHIESGTTSIFAATPYRVSKSTDNGNTWVEITSSPFSVIRAMKAIGETLIVVTNNSLYRYNGSSWALINSGLPNDDSFGLTSIGGELFLAKGEYVYTSVNNGDSWTTTSDLSFFQIYKMEAVGSALFLSTEDDFFKSVDGGSSWSTVNMGLSNLPTHAIVRGSDWRLYAATRSGGVYVSSDSDGTTWSSINTGLPFSRVVTLRHIGNNQILAGTYGSGLFQSGDGGQNWTSIPAVASLHISCIYQSEGTIYVGTYTDGLYKTDDNGISWICINSDLFVDAIIKKENTVFVAAWDGVYSYENNVLTKISEENGIYTMTVKDGYLYAGTLGSEILKSTNGIAWELCNGNFSGWIHTITVLKDTLFASAYDGLFYSTNGLSWNQLDITNQDLREVGEITEHNGSFFAASTIGLLRSVDNGFSWHRINSGIQSTDLNTVIAVDDMLYVGTFHDGVLKRGLTSDLIYTSSMESFSTIIGSPSSAQNFTLTGDLVPSNITIEAPSGFEVSKQNTANFSNSITINAADHLAIPIYVRFNPESLEPVSGTIIITCPGMNTQSIEVSGVAQDVVLGLNESALPFQVYPNPTSGFVKLVANRDVSNVSLTNLMGQPQRIEWNSFNESDLKHLAPGIYLLKVMDGEKLHTISIVRK